MKKCAVSWIGRLNIVKMSNFLKWFYRFNASSMKKKNPSKIVYLYRQGCYSKKKKKNALNTTSWSNINEKVSWI